MLMMDKVPQILPAEPTAEPSSKSGEMLNLWLSAWQPLSSILLTPPTWPVQIQPLRLCTGEQTWQFPSLYSWCPRLLILVRMEKCSILHPTERFSVLMNVPGLKLHKKSIYGQVNMQKIYSALFGWFFFSANFSENYWKHLRTQHLGI